MDNNALFGNVFQKQTNGNLLILWLSITLVLDYAQIYNLITETDRVVDTVFALLCQLMQLLQGRLCSTMLLTPAL